MKRSVAFGKILKHCEPRLANHLLKLGIEPSFYVPAWFMSSFLNAFDFAVAIRVFDQIISEGSKAFYRAGIALLKIAS